MNEIDEDLEKINKSKEIIKSLYADMTIYGIENQHQNEQKFIDDFKSKVEGWKDFTTPQKYGINWTIDKLTEIYNLGTNIKLTKVAGSNPVLQGDNINSEVPQPVRGLSKLGSSATLQSASDHPTDNQKGCGKEVWDDSCKTYRKCGYLLGFPDDYLLCDDCKKKEQEK